MQIRIIGQAEDGADVHEFYHWLRRSPDVVRSAEVRLGSDGLETDGRMGVIDVIDVVLSNALALGSFLTAYASWRSSRSAAANTHSPLTLTNGAITVQVHDADPDTLQRIREVLGPNGPTE